MINVTWSVVVAALGGILIGWNLRAFYEMRKRGSR